MAFAIAANPLVEPLPFTGSPAAWYERVQHLPQPMLLTSGSSKHAAARFDILVADPIGLLRTRHGVTRVTTVAGSEVEASSDDPFAVLQRHFPLQDTAAHPELPFTGGAVAWFGYELLHGQNRIEPATATTLTLPDMLAGIYDWAVIVDHHTQRTSLVLACVDRDRARRVRELFAGAGVSGQTIPFRLLAPFKSNYSCDEYLQRFHRIIDYIHAGDCYQVNLAQCFTAPCDGDSWQAFLRLQARANAPFAAILRDGDQSVLSFSPERFLKVDNGIVTTQPIKGTRPRSSDTAQDAYNRHELETSIKDRAENLMIVDLLRNDLGRVCATGSVSVDKLFEMQSFTNVHHLVSTIHGRLRQPVDVFRLMAACFPGGSITGTPKLRAMQIINELETMPRSVYCGVIGWIDRSGNMDSNIAIRTLVRDGNYVHCWGGGGIVADSVGAEEYQETFDKISMLIDGL